MDVADLALGVSPDGGTIILRLSDRRCDVECAIAREALEAYLWLHKAGEVMACRSG